MLSRMGLIWRTVRHLTFRQIVFQVMNRLRGRAWLRLPKQVPATYFLPVSNADKPVSYQYGTFTFLNKSVRFLAGIDWNYNQLGTLWTYNLNYFDFLNQPTMRAETGLELIHDFIAQTDLVEVGLEPYPTSLRIMNWVYFLSRHQIHDERINRHLFAQASLLGRRFEYHLAGNHLLENGFALLTVALYFRQKRWFNKASRLIQQELTRQILADGGHDERSPMYHQLILDRMLTIMLTLQVDTWPDDQHLLPFLREKAVQMLAWLGNMTFSTDDVPMVNDAALAIAPSTVQLQQKAYSVLPDQKATHLPLTTSGYRMFRQKRYELIVDAGPIGPDHQPGHAHADTFSFVLYVDKQPVIVDVGTSTYETGPRRAWERSTIAHNTVTVQDANSSEVWARFRVGRRARVTLLADSETMLTAYHTGFSHLGIIHQRTWLIEANQLTLLDSLVDVATKGESEQVGIARFYFYPTIALQVLADGIQADSVKIIVDSVTKPTFHVTTYPMADGFNLISPGQCLEVAFIGSLKTTLILTG